MEAASFRGVTPLRTHVRQAVALPRRPSSSTELLTGVGDRRANENDSPGLVAIVGTHWSSSRARTAGGGEGIQRTGQTWTVWTAFGSFGSLSVGPLAPHIGPEELGACPDGSDRRRRGGSDGGGRGHVPESTAKQMESVPCVLPARFPKATHVSHQPGG